MSFCDVKHSIKHHMKYMVYIFLVNGDDQNLNTKEGAKMGQIEVGKTYVVSPFLKKSLTAHESFKDADGREVIVTKLYRNGEFIITIHTEEEADALDENITERADPDSLEQWHTDDFSDWTLTGAYDGQGIHFEYDGTKYDGSKGVDYYEFLHDRGFKDAGEEWMCLGGLEVYKDCEVDEDVVIEYGERLTQSGLSYV